jgi:hypothetical protein
LKLSRLLWIMVEQRIFPMLLRELK